MLSRSCLEDRITLMRIRQVQFWISEVAHCNIDRAKEEALIVDNLEKEQPVS